MTIRERLLKTKEFMLIMTYYLVGYFIIAELTRYRSDIHTLALPFEKNIPLYPAFVFAYLMNFGLLAFAYIFVEDLDHFRRMTRAFFFSTTIHYIVFLIYPVEYKLRPVVDPNQGWAYFLVYFYYWMDPPYNCFPSMHVSNCFLVSFLVHRYHKVAGYMMLLVALFVAVSVVLVKQHYIADVVTGCLVAWISYIWEFKEKPALLPKFILTPSKEEGL